MTKKAFLNKFQKEEIIEFPHQEIADPIVSVCVQTYWHENYIRKCLEGILEQKTNFEFEILLGEDDSPDNTRQICIEYAKKYPEKIRLFLHDRANNIKINGNPTGRFNFLYNLYSARGKYITLCEGDDYWTDPNKLQKQVDFLEVNEDFAITFCNVLIKNENENIPAYPGYQNEKVSSEYLIQTIPTPKKVSDIYDIAKGNFIHTPGVVFRNIFRENPVPGYMKAVPIGDWPLYMYISRYGKIAYTDEIMTVYRVHNSGAFSSVSEARKEYLGLNQYPPMIQEGIFDNKILKIWENHLVSKLADFFKQYLNLITENEFSILIENFNSLSPSILIKSIELLTNEIKEKNEAILGIQSSRSYNLSLKLKYIMRFFYRKFPFSNYLKKGQKSEILN